MKEFTTEEIEKYLKYTDENVIPVEEVLGQCFICGENLNEVELPEGAEKKVVCLKDREFFVENFLELKELGELY